jgi:hypothetical protein
MQWKKVKKLITVVSAVAIVTSLVGCGSKSASDSGSSDEKASNAVAEQLAGNILAYDTDDELSSKTVIGSVTSIDDDTLTLSIMGAFDSDEIENFTNMAAGGFGGEAPSDTDGFTMDGNESDGLVLDGDNSSDGFDFSEGGFSDGEMPEKPEGDGSESGDGSIPDNAAGEVPEKSDGDEAKGSAGEAPEKPDGDTNQDSAGEVPEKPDGDSSSDTDGEAPEMPSGGGFGNGGEQPSDNSSEGGLTLDGDASDSFGQPGGDMNFDGTQPDGEMSFDGAENASGTLTIQDESVISWYESGETASLSDIEEGMMIAIVFDENGLISEIKIADATDFGMGGAMTQFGGDMSQSGEMGGQSSGVDSYTAVNEYTEDTELEDESFESSGADENAILVSAGAEVTLSGITVDRTSDDSTGGDDSSFYGVGAAVLTTDGTTYISDSEITTDSAGGAGVFAYGDGTVYIKDSTISTKKDTSGGIHAAGGGTLYAWNLDVTTEGGSAAAIRSDRGGGTMVIDGGTYTSNGTGSPSVYCTADIAVNDATLTANGSEAICMEGLNTIHLFDCDISGNMSDDSQNDTTWNIIVYQSMSGDSEVGNSTMQIIGGSVTAKNGGMFYTTNTECDILIQDVDFSYAKDSEFFLMCTGNNNQRGWGNTGANGSDCTFTAISQEMEGNIIWDSISELDFYMMDGSTLTGAFINDETYAGNGGDGYANIYISGNSTWVVTEDSTLTSICNRGKIVDASGNQVKIVSTDGTVLIDGDSDVTVTVSSYTEADFAGSSQAAEWYDYAIDEF